MERRGWFKTVLAAVSSLAFGKAVPLQATVELVPGWDEASEERYHITDIRWDEAKSCMYYRKHKLSPIEFCRPEAS